MAQPELARRAERERGARHAENLRREGVSERELGIALRQSGLLTAAEARFVYLEPNGAISVIPYRDGQPEPPMPRPDAG